VGTLDVTGISRLVVDARGRTLYTNNVDTASRISCGTDCTKVWRPVTVPTEEVPSKVEGINGTFGVVRRPDKTLQLALNGRPLYTSTKDADRGTLRGNGIVDSYRGVSYTWHAVAALGGNASPEPTPSVSVSSNPY
jgi:predicted lipoprotein with Yx(FWY)xxD motif